MIEEEHEAILASLHEWVAENHLLISKTLNIIRHEGVSNYPILIASDESNIPLANFGVLLPKSSPSIWSAACSTLERWAKSGGIQQERIPDFCQVYKANGEDALCIMVLKAEFQHCIFINLKDMEKNDLLQI